MTTNYKKLRSSAEQCVDLAISKMACLEAMVVTVTQERDANVAKTKQVLLEAQCVSGLAKEAKKVLEHVSAFETSAQLKVLKDDKLLQ